MAPMNQEPLILVVDDDVHIREIVCFALCKAGYRTAEAGNGRQALSQCNSLHPALLILDILMPELDGTEVCRALRAKSKTPIIFLTSMDDEIDRVVGLELGGDDYLTKPFSPRELVARVRAVLRRAVSIADRTEVNAPAVRLLKHGLLELNLDRFQAFWDSREIILTVTEFGIVRTLLQYPGKVFSRDELMNGAYSNDYVVTDRTIDSHIRRVRRKFAEAGGDPIETVHGVGYKLGACGSSS
jgi:two-component system, OmpR family, response regulator